MRSWRVSAVCLYILMLQNIYFVIFILSLYEVIGNLTLNKIPSLKAILYHPLNFQA